MASLMEWIVCNKFALRVLLSLFFFASVSGCLVPSTDATADLLIAPSNGTTVFDGTNAEEATWKIPTTSFTGRFYGQTRPDIYIAENGNLNFVGSGITPSVGFEDPSSTPASRVARIAPLWDDVLMVPNGVLQAAGQRLNNVIYHPSAGNFLAVTWENSRLQLETVFSGNFPDTPRSFQVVWFEKDMNMRGQSFLKDDIVFSYTPHQVTPDRFGEFVSATVGVTLDGLNTFTTADNSTNSFFESPRADTVLPWQDNRALLFRPNTLGTAYNASIIALTAVPEPTTSILIGFISGAFVVRLIARRKAYCFARFS
jgi:hypothetical protein